MEACLHAPVITLDYII